MSQPPAGTNIHCSSCPRPEQIPGGSRILGNHCHPREQQSFLADLPPLPPLWILILSQGSDFAELKLSSCSFRLLSLSCPISSRLIAVSGQEQRARQTPRESQQCQGGRSQFEPKQSPRGARAHQRRRRICSARPELIHGALAAS